MINKDRIEELREEVGEDELDEVIELFCEEVEDVLRDLRNVSQTEIAAQLHFLKGSAANIGLDGVSDICRQQESLLSESPNAALDISAIISTYEAEKLALLGS